MDGPLKSFVLTVTFTSIQVESEYELKLPTSLLARCTDEIILSLCSGVAAFSLFPFRVSMVEPNSKRVNKTTSSLHPSSILEK